MTSEENNKEKIASPNNILLEALKKKKEKLASGSKSFKGGGPTGDKYSGKGKNFSPAGAGNSLGHRPTGR